MAKIGCDWSASFIVLFVLLEHVKIVNNLRHDAESAAWASKAEEKL